MIVFLKLALLLFWATWFSIVFLTNAFDAMKAAGMLPATWRFASRNYEMVVKAVSIYEAPKRVARLLFGGVLAWQALAAVLFWRALGRSASTGAVSLPTADAAFAAGILLWAAFMIADEITIKYAMEQPHELLLIAQLGSLLVIHLV